MQEHSKVKHPPLDIRVLYVEDEEQIRTWLTKALGRAVKSFFVGTNGKEGLELFKEHAPDVVITDIRMPVMDGIEMSKAIRHINKDVTIVITTAHNDTKILMDAIAIGVNEFLLKPIDTNRLVTILQKISKELILEQQLKLQQERQKTILDFVDSMILLTDGKEILQANKQFLDFFDIQSIEELKEITNCGLCGSETTICTKEDWLARILSREQGEQTKTEMVSRHGDKMTFLVKHSCFPQEYGLFIISFTDVTQMEEEQRLLQELAETDMLTKVYNRMKFEKLLTTEIERNKRYSLPLSLIMFDIDHFKDVNDNYGHERGDYVLAMIARIVSGHIRATDMLARWGGEEFMILAPNTDKEGARILAEGLRKEIEANNFEQAGTITASFGVTQYESNETPNILARRVDCALYSAKNNGRNRVETA